MTPNKILLHSYTPDCSATILEASSCGDRNKYKVTTVQCVESERPWNTQSKTGYRHHISPFWLRKLCRKGGRKITRVSGDWGHQIKQGVQDTIGMNDVHVPCLRGDIITSPHHQPRRCLQLMTVCKGKMCFLKWVTLGIQTMLRKAPRAAVDVQHKINLVACLEDFFVWQLFMCLVG